MQTTRLEIFSDAVIAIAMTIMVLELRAPHDASWNALVPLVPIFLSYVLSFVFLAIYWNNHHHLLTATDHIDGHIMWANLHLLFWLSLIPFTTAWMAENEFAPVPVAAYGIILLLAGVAYYLLQRTILRHCDANNALREALGKDGKGRTSVALYALAVALAFLNQWLAIGVYVIVALMWLIPDRRIEKILHPHH